MSKIKKVRIPSLESFTIRNDLSARKLTTVQIEKVLQWIEQQQSFQQSYVSIADVENYFRDAGFSQEESEAVVITLYKEAVRPWLGWVLLAIIAGVYVIILLIGKL